MGSGYVSSCVPLDDHTYLYSGDRGLKLYDTETQETENYLNWMDCNISSSSVSSFGVLSDGRVVVYMQTWSTTYSTDIAILDEISAEEAGNVKQINVACFYMGSNTESAAIEFNKKHTDYHINVTSYYDYSSDVEYQDALDSFATAISTDTSIDIVFFNDYSQMLDFAAKGLLVDLNEFLADDADLGDGKILPNIINACTFNDKLVALPNYFSVETLVGKVSDVGTTPGWTVADLKKLYESKDSDTQILWGYTKENVFNMCISLGYNQFLDFENKTCDFNNQDFIDVLEFASLFPDEYTNDDETDMTELMHSGKILLYETTLPDFGQMQMLSTIFDDDLTYIGYPTASGNGTMMYFSGLAGITKYCEDADMAWEFLRGTYIPEDSSDYYGSYFNGSILQSEFDKFFDSATNEDNYGGTWGWGNYETAVHAPTQAEVDQVKDIILNSTAVSGAVSSGILNIIEEEAAAYFSGQKTAADVAANIQSRMEIYLSETM
jgi:ABC-type glycerol-3-phosphate transport system substrate-binding protein